MWNHKKVSAVFITRNNSESIRNQIEDTFSTGYVDEVLVVDCSSEDRTLSEVSYTKARVAKSSNIYEAFRLSLDRVSGELIVYCDSSGIVPAKELIKLLAYSDTSSFVFSSRRRWLKNEIEGKDKKLLLKNLKFSTEISNNSVIFIDDIFPPVFLLNKSDIKFEFKFSSYVDLFCFEILANCILNRTMYFQIPVEFHSYSLESDKDILTNRKKISAIKNFIKDIKKNNSSIKQSTISNYDIKDDPEEIKKRIRYIRRRLGDYHKPHISDEARSKIEEAIRKASKSRNKSS